MGVYFSTTSKLRGGWATVLPTCNQSVKSEGAGPPNQTVAGSTANNL
jgi:hypothetical protein